jgi:pyrroline-5-carboxylate reductase
MGDLGSPLRGIESCSPRAAEYASLMTYAFLGAGKMALALVHGMLRAKVCGAADILVSSRSRPGLENFVAATAVRPMASNAEAVAAADLVVLCVKPTDALKAVRDGGADWSGKILVSVATGLKIGALQEAAPGARVIRAMPNTAAMVGKSATALAADARASGKDIAAAQKIFGAVGSVFPVAENHLDAVTGVSGSGPAYIYLVMEALSDGGVACGLPRKLALDLAVQTIQGAAEMVASTQEHPAVLREMVTSSGGTTIAALGVLEKQAVRAAAARSKELSGE